MVLSLSGAGVWQVGLNGRRASAAAAALWIFPNLRETIVLDLSRHGPDTFRSLSCIGIVVPHPERAVANFRRVRAFLWAGLLDVCG